MAKRRNILYCEECGEFINSENFVSCEICKAPLHEWCAVKKLCESYSDIYFCKNCAEELDDEDCLDY